MLRGILQGLAIAAISVGLVVGSELLLRQVYPEKVVPLTKHLKKDCGFQFDPDYLISLTPNSHKVFQRTEENGGDGISWQTNADGFRGPPLRASDLRIMVYGDSQVHARFSRLEDTFTEKLGAALRDDLGLSLETINAGVVGFGPDQSLIRLKSELKKYRPKLVLLVLDDNDFGDIVRNRLFDLSPSGTLVPSPHPLVMDRTLFENAGVNEDPFYQHAIASLLVVRGFRRIAAWVSRSSKNRPVDTLEELRRTNAAEYAIYKQRRPRYFSHFADHYDIDVATEPNSESARAKVQLMDAVLREIQEECDSNGTIFLAVLLPSTQDIPGPTSLRERLLECPKYSPSRLTSTLERICQAHQIPVVNLFPAFSAHSGDSLYFQWDDHWNDAGQSLAAEETAHFINAELLSGAKTIKRLEAATP